MLCAGLEIETCTLLESNHDGVIGIHYGIFGIHDGFLEDVDRTAMGKECLPRREGHFLIQSMNARNYVVLTVHSLLII